MKYDAITLDTSIFERNGFRFESGLLAQLNQFGEEGSIDFIVSEVVLTEVLKHLIEKTKTATHDLGKSIKEAKEFGLFPEENIIELDSTLSKSKTYQDASLERINNFAKETNMQKIPANKADIDSLIKKYFKTEPPFEKTGTKKNEFPDAIALISLENWAKENNKRIIAVSGDKGWLSYKSDWIGFSDDLTTVLADLQDDKNNIEKHITKTIANIAEGKNPNMMEFITDRLETLVQEIDVYAEADSTFYFESDDHVYLTLKSFEFSNRISPQLIIISREKIVASIDIAITVNAETWFSISVYDSTDKDLVSLGQTHAQKEETFDTSILLTFTGDFSSEKPEFEITEVEIIEHVQSIHFGEIEPDFDDYQYDYDEYT